MSPVFVLGCDGLCHFEFWHSWGKSTLLSGAARYPIERCFVRRFSKFRPTALQIRGVVRWSWVWSIGEMILTEVKWSTPRKTCPSTIHTENPTRCNNVSKFYYSVFRWSSTCFGRHTVHHQEPKTALAASGFHTWKVVGRVVGGRCQVEYLVWEGAVVYQTTAPSHAVPDNVHQLHVQQSSTYEKPEAVSAVLGSWWWAVCRSKHVELHINMK